MREDGAGSSDCDPGQQAANEAEILDTGSQTGLLGRIPAWVRAVVTLAVAAGLVAVALHRTGHPTGTSAQPGRKAASVASVHAAPPAGAKAQAVRQAGPTPAETRPALARADALDRLAYLADFGHPLMNNLRGLGVTPTCPQIPIGDDPPGRVAAALRSHLHSVALNDSSFTMNADATLCGMDVRARTARKARVIVEIVAPSHAADVALRAERRTGARVLRAVGIIAHRWQVTVGWVGPAGQAPSAAALAGIARDRRLRW